MNKIFTLFALGMVCLYANVANAQVTETFDGNTPSCFVIENSQIVNGAVQLPNNTTTTGADVPVNILTPYYNFTTTTASISFSYEIFNNINGNKSRIFRIGTMSQNGVITYSDKLTINGNNKTETQFEVKNNSLKGTANISFPIQTGIQRIVITYTGDGGKAVGTFDNLFINSSYYYTSGCNTAPVATDNRYAEKLRLPISGNLMTDQTPDYDDNSESFRVFVVNQPDAAIGKVDWSEDGSFTFTPGEFFRGGPIAFTYQIIDNGYNPTPSNIATVSLIYPEMALLPVSFIAFSGSANDDQAVLNWTVADNHTGSHFIIEKSTDAKTYQPLATQFVADVAGTASYNFTDAGFNSNGAFYRIKAVNKDKSSAYSKTVYIKGSLTANNNITLMQNPVQSSLNFAFTSATDEVAEMAIFNMAGVKIYSQKIQAHKGTNSFNLNIDSKLVRGNYILTVQSATTRRSVQLAKQ